MKLKAIFSTAVLLLALSLGAAVTQAQGPTSAEGDEQNAPTSSVAAEADVVVTLCVNSGDVVVHGTDKREVRARASEAERIELRRAEAADKPAKRVEVLISNNAEGEIVTGECGGSSNVLLEVPRGATVVLKVQSGDIEVSDVAEARIESLSGDVEVSRVSKSLEVEKISGDISLRDSSGRVRLRSFSGQIEAVNIRRNEDSDFFIAKAASGEITLERITHARVEADSVSGDISYEGALARGGSYDFKTHSGSIGLTLPADSSFRLNAKVVAHGEIITDFPVKTPGGTSGKETPQSRLAGTVGTGDAEVNLTSFNGTVQLKKH